MTSGTSCRSASISPVGRRLVSSSYQAGGSRRVRVRRLCAFPVHRRSGHSFWLLEAIFPGQVINEKDRPDWMVNVTNDAWFGTSAGPRQHLAAARLRAVEEGLPLMRAANTGISAAFDARGHEITRLGMEITGFRTVSLPGPLPPTVFARCGLVLPGGLALGSLMAGLLASRWQRARQSRPT